MYSNIDKDKNRTVSFYEHNVLVSYYINVIKKRDETISNLKQEIVKLKGQLECTEAKLEIKDRTVNLNNYEGYIQ
mgnify:CR=1 FL=1